MDKVDLLFDRFLHFLQGMGKVDPSTSTCCLAVSYLFFGTWTKVDLLFDRFLLVLQSMDKVDPSTSTCCLFLTCSSGPMSMEEVDPKYLIPLFDRLFCCLPASWRRVLRCNREFPKRDVSQL